jgi:hypothetical protein
LTVHDDCVRRVREVDEVRLVGFDLVVGRDTHVEGPVGLTGRERERSASGVVIATGDGGPVGGRILHGHRLPARRAQRDGELGLRIARITLDNGDVVDRKRGQRIVVEDGPQACAVGDRRVDRVREDDRVRLIRFVEDVAVHLHRQRLRGLTGRDR